MSSYATGHNAEERAARYLSRQGFKVRELNWRTRFCEIDIVAEKAGRIHFVEVKYRAGSAWGGAIEYITPHKLKRMRFAAGFWLAKNRWPGESQLAVVSIDGSTYRLELIDV